jgi:hypothetical protein
MKLLKEQPQRVTVDGAIHGHYVLEEERPDGSVLLRPAPYPAVVPDYPGGVRRPTPSSRSSRANTARSSRPTAKVSPLAPPASPGGSYQVRFDPDALAEETTHTTDAGQAVAVELGRELETGRSTRQLRRCVPTPTTKRAC